MTGRLHPLIRAARGSEPPGLRTVSVRTAASFDLAAYRRHRFAGGLQCPRCDGRSVHRWGRFRDRQRYRCLGCRRTFSDLTGTHLAYLKKLDRWPSFLDGMLASQPIRRTAREVGIHASTVFRWRHRLLEALRSGDDGCLEGDIAIGETCFPYSQKGHRDLKRAPRRRGDRSWWLGERVWVLLARDGGGRPLAENTGLARPRVQDMARILVPRIAPDARILDAAGPFGAASCLARREGLEYSRLRGQALINHPALRYGRQLRRWLTRFRGVATKYLSNYLAWHRYLALGQRSIA